MASSAPPPQATTAVPAAPLAPHLPECPPHAYLLRISASPGDDVPPKLPPVNFMYCTVEQAKACVAAGQPIPVKKRFFMHQRELCGAAAAVRAASVLRDHGGSLESAEAAVH
eukprot:8308515-Alexandrium_andersonii.AAC.1